VALAVEDLVDADAVQALQASVVQVLGHDPGHDRGHGLPGAAQQPSNGGLVDALGQVEHHVFEAAGEPGCWTSPRHRLGADPSAGPAGQPADLRLQVEQGGAQIQVPPAAGGAVIDRPGGPAARPAQPATPAAQAHHDPGRGEHHPVDVGAGGWRASWFMRSWRARVRSSDEVLVGLAAPKPTKDGACASSPAARRSWTPYRSPNDTSSAHTRPTEPEESPFCAHGVPSLPVLLDTE
jgi:hypothetical protein